MMRNVNPDACDSLATRLRAVRRAKRWTQLELARAAGTTQAAVQKIENGKSRRPRALEGLAEALDVKPWWLLFGVREMQGLSGEAIEVAKAWACLGDRQRSALRDEMLRIGVMR